MGLFDGRMGAGLVPIGAGITAGLLRRSGSNLWSGVTLGMLAEFSLELGVRGRAEAGRATVALPMAACGRSLALPSAVSRTLTTRGRRAGAFMFKNKRNSQSAP